MMKKIFLSITQEVDIKIFTILREMLQSTLFGASRSVKICENERMFINKIEIKKEIKKHTYILTIDCG